MDQLFDQNDFELVVKVLNLHPDLELIAYVTKLARSKLRYPIKDYDDLLPALDHKDKVLHFRQETITFPQIKKFIPKKFFPIESEDQFISRMLIALMIGRQSHQQTAELSKEMVFNTATNSNG